jgi:hypothetical protein
MRLGRYTEVTEIKQGNTPDTLKDFTRIYW